MKNEKIELVPKRKKQKFLSKFFLNKKTRYLYLFLFIIPLAIVIGVLSYLTYSEAKSLMALASGGSEIKKENIVTPMNYVLRENATDIQKEYFAELKNKVEVEGFTDTEVAGLVCKNYVADFYTLTNKQGQYDISALYYVYSPLKDKIYIEARDGFYKYLNYYINSYGSDGLLEVETVDVVKSNYAGYIYSTDDESFDTVMDVKCTWTYKEGSKMDASKYATSMNFLVVERAGRYEIVEASENTINARTENE